MTTDAGSSLRVADLEEQFSTSASWQNHLEGVKSPHTQIAPQANWVRTSRDGVQARTVLKSSSHDATVQLRQTLHLRAISLQHCVTVT